MSESRPVRRFGSYELVAPIGEGGMGSVWRARHTSLGREAALKLIGTQVQGNRDELNRRFAREARATSQLRSPHTVEVYDYGTTADGAFYYAMELLDGLDLRSMVERFGPMPEERAVFLVRQVALSLAEAHDAGLLHRDIKPANLFACRMGVQVDFMKVLDFGLVAYQPESGMQVSQLTRADVAPGSPAFMSPEAVEGAEHLDGRADLYGLGCVLYWCLTGCLVFEAKSSFDMVLAHLRETPVAPSERTELPISPALDALVMRCLDKSPEVRPASARALYDELGAISFSTAWDNSRADAWWSRHQPRAGGAMALQRTERTEPDTRATDGPPDSQLARAQSDALRKLRHEFVHSGIDFSEMELRVAQVRAAQSPDDVGRAIATLAPASPERLQEAPAQSMPRGPVAPFPEPAPPSDVPANAHALVLQDDVLPARPRAKRQTLLSIFSGTSRRGDWAPAETVNLATIMGGAHLDFRDVDLPPGETVVRCIAVMGGAEITVPPDVEVITEGVGIMGGFDQKGRRGRTERYTSRIRVTGVAVMGGVVVKTRVRGEPT